MLGITNFLLEFRTRPSVCQNDVFFQRPAFYFKRGFYYKAVESDALPENPCLDRQAQENGMLGKASLWAAGSASCPHTLDGRPAAGSALLLRGCRSKIKGMTVTVKALESAITSLSPAELAELAAWFEEFQADAWDQQIERDVRAGRLDALLKQAEKEFNAGRCRSVEP